MDCETKKKIVWEVVNTIMEHGNKMPVQDWAMLKMELAEQYGVSVRTIERVLQNVDFIFVAGFPRRTEGNYFVCSPPIAEVFRKHRLSIHKYIDLIRDEDNLKALKIVVDMMVRYDYEPRNPIDDQRVLVGLLKDAGFTSDIPERTMWRILIVTYELETELVNGIDYLLQDFYDEPIDLSEELDDLC